MKKTFIGLVILAVAVVIGVPYITGVVAETKSKELVEQFNASYPQLGAIEILNYERSFRSSTSTYKYTFSELYKKATQFNSFEYSCNLSHGVTGVDYACSLANTGEQKVFFDQYFSGKDPFSMTGNISAFGIIDQTLSIDPVTIQTDDGSVIVLSEKAALTTVYDRKSSSYDFDGEIPNLKIEATQLNDPIIMTVDSVIIAGGIKEVREGLYVGDVNFSGDQFKTQGRNANEQMLINDFRVTTSTNESGNTISSIVEMNAKSATIPNQNGGLDSFSDVSMDIGMYDMDTDALAKYIKFNQELQKKIFASDNGSQQALSSMAELIPVAEKLLKKDLGIKFNSSAKVDGKASNFVLDLKLINDIQFSQVMGFLFSPDETLKNFKGKVDLELNKTLIEKYPELAFLTASVPVFEQKSDGVVMNVNIDNGLKLNGQETTVQELQGLFR